MNYNYILYKLLLCILGYMFRNNTRKCLNSKLSKLKMTEGITPRMLLLTIKAV